MRHLSKPAFLWLIVFGILMSWVLSLMFWGAEGVDSSRQFVALGFLSLAQLLFVVVPCLFLLYRGWATIQDGHARTSPARAVLFLLIPVFNLYWVFQAVWGLAKDYNSYVKRHGTGAKQLSEGVFLGYAVLGILSAVAIIVGTLITQILAVGVFVAILDFALSLLKGAMLCLVASQLLDAINASSGTRRSPWLLDPLAVLGATAAFSLIVATVTVSVARRAEARRTPSGPAYLIQGLDPGEIARVEVGTGADATRVVRQEGRFVVAGKANYPADPKQLNDLITKCLDIKTIELYTDNPKNHEDLEVTEEKAKNVIKFFKADGSLLMGVLVGKSVETGQGTYVRLASADPVYLAESVPWFRSTSLEYVNQEIVSVQQEDVNAVTVTTSEGAYTLRGEKEGDGAVLDNLPAGRTLKESDAKSVFNALTSLRFDDVNTPATVAGLSFDQQYVCRLDNTTTYTLKMAQKGEKTYLMCDAVYADTTPVTKKPGQVESEEELKKKEAKLQAQEAAQKFTRRHKGWVYEVPDWKAKYLTMAQTDLLEEKEAEVQPAETSAPTEAQDTSIASEPVAEPAQPADPNAGAGQ